jgi:hypothetical protein
MELKGEKQYSSSSHPQRDSLIVSIMEEILSQSMISVTVCDRIIARISFRIAHGGRP